MLKTIQATRVFEDNYTARERIVVNEGGSRSGKTVALAQTFLTLLYEEPRAKLEVVRGTMPALKATAMEDFFEQMHNNNLYDVNKHNRTDHIYRHKKNSIGFFSVDDSQKIRGRKRDYLWINEANELTFSQFNQLAMRTTKQIYMDFNPPDEDHWIVQKVLTRPDTKYIHSTYLDNPFLSVDQIHEIEYLKETDPNYWQVFGLGKRGVSGTKIWTHFRDIPAWPGNDYFDEVIYGIDFAYNKPSAIVRIGIKDKCYTWDELLYETNLTNPMLIERMEEMVKDGLITKKMTGYADTAEPDRIKEIELAGFNIHASDKSVSDGIGFVKSRKQQITATSLKTLGELKYYSFKTKADGTVLDEPVKVNDHAMDAGRYAIYTHHKSEHKKRTPRIRTL